MEKKRIVCPHCGAVNAVPYKEQYEKANCGQCKKSLLDTKPIALCGEAFDTMVANSDIPIIVDFWAAWCGPCKMMAPVFEQVATRYSMKARFVKVDSDNCQVVAQRFNISSIPTLIAIKNNQEVGRSSGAMSPEQLNQWVAQYL